MGIQSQFRSENTSFKNLIHGKRVSNASDLVKKEKRNQGIKRGQQSKGSTDESEREGGKL